jgi:O-antigen ligase
LLKINNLISSTTLILIFLGFYYISFLPDIGFPSEITIVIRGIVLFFCFISFINFSAQKNISILFLFVFLGFYFFRLFTDIYFKGLYLGKSPFDVIIFFLGVTIFPSIALLNQNLKNAFNFTGKYLYLLFNLLSILLLIFNKDSGRLSGNSVLNPISAAEISASSLLINFILFFHNISITKRILNFIFLLINIIVLILSASRGPLLSILFCFLFYLFFNKKISAKIVIFILILFGVVGYIVMVYSESLGLIFLDRMLINTGDIDKPEENRVLLWQEGYEIISKNLLLGTSTTTTNGYVHNFFLELVMSTGIIGLFIFFVPLLKAFTNLKKHVTSDNYYLQWIGLLFVQYFIGGLFSSMIYTNNYFFYFLILVISNPKVPDTKIHNNFIPI